MTAAGDPFPTPLHPSHCGWHRGRRRARGSRLLRSGHRQRIQIGTKSGQRHPSPAAMATPAGRTTTAASRMDTPASPARALDLGAADKPLWQDWRAEGERRVKRQSRALTVLCLRRVHSSLAAFAPSIPLSSSLPHQRNVSLSLDLLNKKTNPIFIKTPPPSPQPLTDLESPRSHAIVVNIVVIANCYDCISVHLLCLPS